jgi:hypothetical protein
MPWIGSNNIIFDPASMQHGSPKGFPRFGILTPQQSLYPSTTGTTNHPKSNITLGTRAKEHIDESGI